MLIETVKFIENFKKRTFKSRRRFRQFLPGLKLTEEREIDEL